MTTILTLGATQAEISALKKAAVSSDEIIEISALSSPQKVSGDVAIFFGLQSSNDLAAGLNRLPDDLMIPVLLVVNAPWQDGDPEEMPVTNVLYEDYTEQNLKDWLDQQRSLSLAVSGVDDITSRGQHAEITGQVSFDLVLGHEVRRFNRYGGEVSLLAIRFEESAGNLYIASTLLRDVDVIASLSANVAVVLLPATPTSGSKSLVERLKANLKEATGFSYGSIKKGESPFDLMTRVTSALEKLPDGGVASTD